MSQEDRLKKRIKEEYVRSAKDPVYFMTKYCKIQHPKRGKIPFDLFPFQRDTLREIKDHRYNVILKARQLGISTLAAGYSLWSMLFQGDFNVLVIATKQTTAKNLVTKVRVMYDLLPSWLKVGTEEYNKLGMRLKNGSEIKAVSASEDAGRSEALSLLIIDEAAFVKNIDTIWTAAQSTLSTGGRAIVLSTPNGVGNFFHKTWVDAESGDNGFNTIRLPWYVHPERDQSYRDEQDRVLGAKEAAQECDCDFMSSGDSVVSLELIKWYKENTAKEPVEKRGIDQGLWIWEKPDYEGREYMVVADVARGDGADYSAFHVIDVDNLEQVAEYRGKLPTKDYGNYLVNIATEYNDALLVIENANIGWAAIQQVIDREYKNLFYSTTDLTVVDTEIQLQKRWDLKDKSQLKPGFSTTMKTRPLIISKLDMYMRDKSPIIRSNRLLTEMETFIYNNGRAEARSGYNDDLTMSWSIGLWVRDTALRLRQEGMELTRQTLSKFQSSKAVYTSRDTDRANSGWTQQDGKGGDLDLTQFLR